MTNFEHIKGSIKAKKAANKKLNPVMGGKALAGFGYLLGEFKNQFKVMKNVALAVSIGSSGLFLSSCASSAPMTANNMITRQGTNQTIFTYTADGRIASRTTNYAEYDAMQAARVQREAARTNRDNAQAFKTAGQGLKEFGKGIEAWRKAFNR